MKDEDIDIYLQELGGGQGFKCKSCCKKVTTRSSARRHVIKIHLNPDQFICQYESCKKVFKSQAGLAGHSLIHTEANPTICPHPGCTHMDTDIKK